MKRYINHIHSKPTHERRQHAARIAMGVTAVVFVGWLATLGWRLSSSPPATAQGSDASQTAGVAGATDSGLNTLQVAPADDTSAGYTSLNGQ